MRSTPILVALVVWAGLGLASIGAAQTAAHPTIHNVTPHEGAGVLTITGTGFGREPRVTVDGQAVTVLQGGTDTQIDVLAPAALLTTPGTYRLTVVDPVREVGDAFVVASHVGFVVPGAGALKATPVPVTAAAPAAGGSAVTGAVLTGAQQSVGAPLPQTVIEDPDFPFRTALGYEALLNTTGYSNTAIGHRALKFNTTGTHNTASGDRALISNTTGDNNTASGSDALLLNATGDNNTANGSDALTRNTTGGNNTASGTSALHFNDTGSNNTASGYEALYSNRDSGFNTASGSQALRFNTTGYRNTASGSEALYSNTTGFLNTASGYQALRVTVQAVTGVSAAATRRADDDGDTESQRSDRPAH